MKKVFLLLAVTLFATTVFAADWGLYGSMRFSTFYVNQSSDLSATGESDTDLSAFGLEVISRIGANIKVNEKFTARFELAVRSSGVATRLMYGQYDFGAFKLRIGQDYSPANVIIFDQVSKDDNDLLGIGSFYEGRLEQIKLIFPFGLELALVKNKQTDTAKYDVTLPKMEVGYNIKAGIVSGNAFGAYQTYSAESETAATFDTEAYVVGFGLQIKPGALGVNLAGLYGSNIRIIGSFSDKGNQYVLPTKDDDTTDYGAAVGVFYKLADNMKLEAGYGFMSSDSDAVKDANTWQSYYANFQYVVAKGFFIQPEIAVYDYMDDTNGNPEGKEVYVGAKWHMNF